MVAREKKLSPEEAEVEYARSEKGLRFQSKVELFSLTLKSL
jgi:hypothetical protein